MYARIGPPLSPFAIYGLPPESSLTSPLPFSEVFTEGLSDLLNTLPAIAFTPKHGSPG